jgi:hypothetical protein
MLLANARRLVIASCTVATVATVTLTLSAITGVAWASPTLHRALRITPPANAAANPLASLFAVECLSAGSCVAGGNYTDSTHTERAMVVTESGHHWARARELRIPGAAVGGVDSIDCVGTRFCVAVGNYSFSPTATKGFVVTRSGGKWGKAHPVAPPTNAKASLGDTVSSVACTRVGSCVLVGYYFDARGIEPMAATESGGRWQRARELLAPLDTQSSRTIFLNAVACPRTGSCVAVGNYVNSAGAFQSLAITESGGRWRRGVQVVAPAGTLFPGGTVLYSVTCTKVGSCIAVGSFTNNLDNQREMVATQRRGIWHRARGLALLPAGGSFRSSFDFRSVACTSAGNCLAIGGFVFTAAAGLGFPSLVATQAGGRWTKARQIRPPPNSATGSMLATDASAIDCTSAGYCAAVGDYVTTSSRLQAMVATTG